MENYDPESVHNRVGYIQYIYKNKNLPNNFENFMLPIVLYGRDGIIADANKMFRTLTRITQDDIHTGAAIIFESLNKNNTGIEETARNAFDGKEHVYIGEKHLIETDNDNPEKLELSDYVNAIFFPMIHDNEGICVAGILLDRDK